MHAIVKYTVFISSTFDDLKAEREQVADAILKLGHIPCGMEQFSAGSGRGWNVITQTIDICDYYVILVAGRYGTLYPGEKLSWTEKEYDYARDRGLEPLAFLRQKDHIIGSRMDEEPSAVASRQAFLNKINEDCRRELWTTGDDLCLRVTMALTKQIAVDQLLGKQRPGWFRGNDLPGNAQVTNELARLSAENAALREAHARAREPFKPNLEIRSHQGEALPETLSLNLVDYSKENVESRESTLRALLSRVFWLSLRIANLGPVPARDVRLKMVITPARRVSDSKLHQVELELFLNSEKLGPKDKSSECVELRQIPILGVNRWMDIRSIAFVTIGDLAEREIVTVNISIDEESGAFVERRIELHLNKGPSWVGDVQGCIKHVNTSRPMVGEKYR
jgi:hypothetical protein